MKDVICYRSSNIDELRKIAKIRNVSLSTITEEIIDDYLHKNTFIKKYDSMRDGKKFIAYAFENLDPSVFEKISTIDANEFVRGVKMSMNDFSLENILSSFRGWMKLTELLLTNENQESSLTVLISFWLTQNSCQ